MLDAGASEGLAMMRAGYATLAAAGLDTATMAELLMVGDELETLSCQLPAQWHRVLNRLQTETDPKHLGAKSWNEVLRTRWRLTTADASRRLAEAADLAPRRTLIGEELNPVLPAVAAAQHNAMINGDHVKVLRDTMRRLPAFVDVATRTQIEVDLVRVAVGVGPKELKETAELRLFPFGSGRPRTRRRRTRAQTRRVDG